jgi:hypothetical protein
MDKKFQLEDLKEQRHLGNPGIEGRIILKLILNIT